MTNCVQCGAELRPGARFCNRCGATQPQPAPETAPVSSVPAQPATAPETVPAPSAVAVEQPAAEIETDDAGQVKRPPRPLRHDTEDAQGAEDAAASGAEDSGASIQSAAPTSPVAAMPSLAELGAGAAGSAPGDQGTHEVAGASAAATATGDGASQTAPTAYQTAPAAPAAPPPMTAAADASTSFSERDQQAPAPATPGTSESESESESAPEPEPVSAAQPHEAPHVAEAPPAAEAVPPSSPSWPLSPGTLAGGRYRVERVTAAVPDAPGAENAYLVTDRRGYERCWSCGAEPGSASASETFCERCGADLLAREYVMTERRLGAPDDEKTMPLTGEPGSVTFFEADRVYRVMPRPAELPPFPAGAYLVAGAASDVGLSRHSGRNEDSLGVNVLSLDSDSQRRTLGIFVVADGLGGHANGHEASQAVVRVFSDSLLRALALPLCEGAPDPTPDALHGALLAAANAANAALLAANETTGADSGATLVAALVWDETAYVANLGDSRGYVFADGALRRLTIDHSLVENLVAGGIIAPEDRYTHPQRNQILRSLGDERQIAVDIFEQRLRPGLRLLLCSDGLWEMVHDDELAHILAETPHPQEAADALVHAANAHGGEDNISAIVIEVRA